MAPDVQLPRGVPAPTSSIFGAWRACTDGRAHYHLAGGPLCGAAAEPTGELVRRNTAGSYAILIPHCATCQAANARRWAKGGRITDGAAA